MKNIIILLLIVLSTSAFAKGTRLKSFCGFEFGSKNPGVCLAETRPLSKPFMKFSKATLIYGDQTEKLNTIQLTGAYPDGTPLSEVRTDASILMDMLTEKYGTRFSRLPKEENDTIVLNYESRSNSDTVIGISILKLGSVYKLNVSAHDMILHEEENAAFIKQMPGYDVL